VGGVQVGDPVVLRGVKVGRVESIRLAPDDWVEADLRLTSPDELPPHPVAIAASASLFGEWQVAVMDSARAPQDPDVLHQLVESISDIRSSVRDLRRMADQLVNFTQRQASAMDRVVANAASGSDNIAAASSHLQSTLARVDSSTSSGQIAEMVRNAREASVELRAASGDLRTLTTAAKDQRERLVHILGATDSFLTRIQSGQGTLGLLAGDSTLYREATRTVVQLRTLLADIQANPRRYFRFSVF
jgi:phospholipid/cholesterol/gamma-HCH transport system substrate-binding protein